MNSGVDGDVVAQLLVFAEQTSDFVGVSDPWGRILYLNPAAKKRLGVVDADGVTLADLFPMETFHFYYEVVRPQLLRTGAWSGEVLVNAAGGEPIPMYVSTTAKIGPGGETNGGVVYAHELSRRDPVGGVDERELDEVTRLPGASAFRDRVHFALASADRDGDGCALVLAEIVDMDEIVGTFGALAAASVMRAIAGRMTRLARTIDVVGRVGDRQLGLLLRGVRGRNEASRIARTVRETLADPPITTASGSIDVSIGCGFALGTAADDPVDLIRRASAAMTRGDPVRGAGAPRTVAERTERTESTVTLDEFRVAMSHGHVRPYAQVVVDPASGDRVGYEALARWNHRSAGTLDAAAFADVIAETSLANEVDLFIARETAAVLALTVGDAPLRLYTPVSPSLLADARTEQYLSEIVDAFGLSMAQLRLELARPVLERWTPALHDALQSVREAGVELVLTGVEHASDLHDLFEHGFREVHLSSLLVHRSTLDADTRRAVAEIARSAHDHGLEAGAAGIRDLREHEIVVEAGCDVATGDLYGRAQPVDTIE
jgi:diguanylate cyclase (GGDEF)-like protein